MSVSPKFVLQQGPVMAAMGRTALAALKQRVTGDAKAAPPPLPGPEVTATLPPRPPELVRAYLRHVGGDPAAYKGTLPPHLWPQWGFGPASRTLVGIPYPLLKVLNGGCRLEMRAPLPAGEPLTVRARLEDIDDNGRRAVLHQRVVTSTPSAPEALIAHLYAIVPLGRGGEKNDGAPPAKKERPRVPPDAEELAYFRLGRDAGLDFAKLTGDFNPVHWVPAYARASGFRGVILHGFATMARAMEGLVRARFAGDPHALAVVDVRFTRPLLLPARVGLYEAPAEDGGRAIFVGDAPGGPAYLTGTYEARDAAPGGDA